MSNEMASSLGEQPARRRRGILVSRGRLHGPRKWVVALLFVVPLALIALRVLDTPLGLVLEHVLSLADIGGRTGRTVGSILLVPLASVIIVFLRVTLGIRVLGPFRSFLLAMAFKATGIPLGLLFFAVVLAIIVLIGGPLKSIKLPYYGRVSVIMSTVAATIVVTLAAGRWLGLDGLSRVALFPIVALCLSGDAFASTLKREGWRSALWRAAVTAGAAVLITEIARIRPLMATLVRFPELVVLEIGVIIVIAEHLGHRLLASLNPPRKKRRKSRKAKKSRSNTGGVSALPAGAAVLRIDGPPAAARRAYSSSDMTSTSIQAARGGIES